MARNVRLDNAGVGAILKSVEAHRLVQHAAEEVADAVRSQGITVGDHAGGKHEVPLPVEVEVTTTDRAKATVLIPHAAGAAVQAKHGALTKAASAAGLKVKSR